MSFETQSVLGQSTSVGSQTLSGTSTGSSGSSVISSDFETFLLMLTTQLENQDPLNPIESQDFAVQLATFSGVEQQVQTNDLLKDLTNALGTNDLAELAGWVGMEARVVAPVTFEGYPIDVVIDADFGSDRAELIVREASGREVAREGVPVSGGVFAWVGRNASGQPLNDGNYTLELASIREGQVTSTEPVPYYADVTEARRSSDGIELVVTGGSVVSATSVTALRQPGES